MLDLTAPNIVEVSIREDGKVLWVNVDGICAVCIQDISQLVVNDQRPDSLVKEIAERVSEKLTIKAIDTSRTNDLWMSFLANEKLTIKVLEENSPELYLGVQNLVNTLTCAGATPKVRPHSAKLITRWTLVRTAMQLGLDLPAIKHKGKIAMGRGLLDAWNQEYEKLFGATYGTAGAKEVKRRNIKTKLAEHRTKDIT